MRPALLAIVLAGCGGHGSTPGGDGVDAALLGCANGARDKIKFEEATSCANDGSVEFCIPDTATALHDRLIAISPTITCTRGGGRAMCNSQPFLLLCSYPTRFPDQCLASDGAMTAATWSDMCEIAGQPEIVEIVPTILE